MNIEKETVYTAKSKTISQSLVGVYQYRDLCVLLAKRNLSVRYKQTILGPLWLLILPLIEAFVSAFVFGNIAKISSGTVPYFLFFYVGATLWYLFSATVSGTGNVFSANGRTFQKVYFPRLTVPFSTLLSTLVTFAVRFFIMLVIALLFFAFGTSFTPAWRFLWLLPFIVLIVACLALGVGLVFSSVTARYRDLSSVLPVFVDLLKYVTPVVYALSSVEGKTRLICLLNPMASLIEAFRFILLGSGNGTLLPSALACSAGVALLVLLFGLFCFNRAEKHFVDLL